MRKGSESRFFTTSGAGKVDPCQVCTSKRFASRRRAGGAAGRSRAPGGSPGPASAGHPRLRLCRERAIRPGGPDRAQGTGAGGSRGKDRSGQADRRAPQALPGLPLSRRTTDRDNRWRENCMGAVAQDLHAVAPAAGRRTSLLPVAHENQSASAPGQAVTSTSNSRSSRQMSQTTTSRGQHRSPY